MIILGFRMYFRVKNKKTFLSYSLLSKWLTKEVKVNYKNEKKNPFQKKKGECGHTNRLEWLLACLSC